MKLRGRRHWKSTIQLGAAEYGSGAFGGRFLGLIDLLPEQAASVQTVSLRDRLERGLETIAEVYWIRCDNPGVLIQPTAHGLLWNGKTLVIRDQTGVEGADLQLLAEVVTVSE